MPTDTLPYRFFEPKEEYSVLERRSLPHWTQAGAICFVTWRTFDSIPRQVAEKWLNDRSAWLICNGVDPYRQGWKC